MFKIGFLGLATVTSSVVAQGLLDIISVNNPGLLFGAQNAAGIDVVAAAGRNPNATALTQFDNSWTGTAREGVWDWRINITNISVPDVTHDLGKPNANYSLHRTVVNTQFQLDWPGVTAGDNSTLEQYLNRTYGKDALIRFAAYHVYLPQDVYAQLQTPNSAFNCSTILNSSCITEFSSAVAGQQLVDITRLQNCGNIASYPITGGVGWPVKASNANETVLVNYPNTTLYSVVSPSVTAGNATQFNRALTALNILTMALHRPAGGGVESHGQIFCQVVAPEIGYKVPTGTGAPSSPTGAGLRLSAASGMALLALLGSVAFVTL